MPPQDDSAPPVLSMAQVFGEKQKQLVATESFYDFLKAPSRSNVSDATEETQLSKSSNSSLPCGSATMTVMGIYTRDKVPREKELPKDYGLSHVKKDQVMCRRRMKTPLKHPAEESEGKELEEAMFVPEQGLVGPMFFHADIDEHDESDDEDEEEDPDWEPRIYEERAILFQAVDHYVQLLDEPKLSKYFKEESEEANAETSNDSKEAETPINNETEIPNKNLQAILENPRFGEQIIVQGIDASQIAIGDIFEIQGGLSPLKVEITCPRLCCAWVDKRQGSAFGLAGVKRFCNKNGMGGFFARVLVAGELRDEMKFIRTAHPHPKWTLAYISWALYGEGPKTYLMASWAHWQRSKEELKELCKLEQLGLYEWKEEAEYILKHWKSYRPKTKRKTETKQLTMMDRPRPLATKLRLDTIFGSDMKQLSTVSPQLLLQVVVALIAFFMAIQMVSAAFKTPNLA